MIGRYRLIHQFKCIASQTPSELTAFNIHMSWSFSQPGAYNETFGLSFREIMYRKSGPPLDDVVNCVSMLQARLFFDRAVSSGGVACHDTG